MGKLRDILNACIDHVLAPECAFDRCSNGYAGSATSAARLGQTELFPMHEPDWHNNWGTAVDFQALNDNLSLVQSPQHATSSHDSYGGSSSGGFGGGMGEY